MAVLMILIVVAGIAPGRDPVADRVRGGAGLRFALISPVPAARFRVTPE